MIIGTFEYIAEQDAYLGDIVTLNFSVERVTFKAIDRKGDKEPDYRVLAPTPFGNVELGAGWKRTSDRGIDFVSVSLDAPLLATPFNAALFLDEGGEKASLVWTRPKAKRATETKSPAAAKAAKKPA